MAKETPHNCQLGMLDKGHNVSFTFQRLIGTSYALSPPLFVYKMVIYYFIVATISRGC